MRTRDHISAVFFDAKQKIYISENTQMINLKKLRKSKGLTLDDILKKRIEMKEIEVGTKVLVRAEVDAFRTGLNSGTRIRICFGDQKAWIKPEDICWVMNEDGDFESIYNGTPKDPEDVATEETDG